MPPFEAVEAHLDQTGRRVGEVSPPSRSHRLSPAKVLRLSPADKSSTRTDSPTVCSSAGFLADPETVAVGVIQSKFGKPVEGDA